MLSRRLLLSAGLLCGLTGRANAMSIDRTELINDGPSFLCGVCDMRVYSDKTVAKGLFKFARKAQPYYELAFGRPDPKAHVLDRGGRPVAATNIRIEEHRTLYSCWLVCDVAAVCYDDRQPSGRTGTAHAC